MIARDRRYIYTLAFVYSIVLVVLVSLPAYLYVQVEKRNYRLTQQRKLDQYAYGVAKSIYDFSRTHKRIYDFPRSVVYGADLYGEKGASLFATDPGGQGREKDTPTILTRKIPLNANRLGAKYLVVSQPFSYREIYIKLLIAALFFGVAVFLMTLFFIRMSLRPFEEANRHLNAFFNDAMHELKTPLGVMQLNLEMIPDRQQSRPLIRLRNSMHNLILVYEDIEYHIKHDHVAYRPETINFGRFLPERIALFRTLAQAKSITIDAQIAPEISVWINRVELQRIIDNTLSNAIKYSPRETTIRIELEERDDRIRFCVLDEGEGIRDPQQVFERYRRENTVQGGFGLGLSIVKHICDRHGIVIDLSSRVGEGSRFCYLFHKQK